MDIGPSSGRPFSCVAVRNIPATTGRHHVKLAVVSPTGITQVGQAHLSRVRLFGVGLRVPRDQREAEFQGLSVEASAAGTGIARLL
jgi:hypothetical protein